jgi:hypothetical protein
VPISLPLGGLLLGTVTANLLACPPNTLEKSLLVGGLVSACGPSSSASFGGGCPLHALVAHVLVAFDITIRFHLEDMVLSGCSSSLADRQA